MAEGSERGLLDTSVLIRLETLDTSTLPRELAVSAISLAESTAGPHATDDPSERAARQDRLQRVAATFDAIPFDAIPFDERAARAYGRVYAEVVAAGRKARGARAVDLLIAATALAHELPVVTANPRGFLALERVIDVVGVP